MIKDVLNALMTPAGLCEPTSLRLVWVNPSLARLLWEHGLEPSLSVRTLAPELTIKQPKDDAVLVREEASLPAHNGTNANRHLGFDHGAISDPCVMPNGGAA